MNEITTPEDLDEHIPELPIEEAQQLYDISFLIVDVSKGTMAITHPDNGLEIRFDTKEEAEAYIKENNFDDNHSVSERRSLKPQVDTLQFNN